MLLNSLKYSLAFGEFFYLYFWILHLSFVALLLSQVVIYITDFIIFITVSQGGGGGRLSLVYNRVTADHVTVVHFTG